MRGSTESRKAKIRRTRTETRRQTTAVLACNLCSCASGQPPRRAAGAGSCSFPLRPRRSRHTGLGLRLQRGFSLFTLIADYDDQVGFGQRRVLLAWTRLILPDGRSITLERQPAGDAAGFAGLEDKVDEHWGGWPRPLACRPCSASAPSWRRTAMTTWFARCVRAARPPSIRLARRSSDASSMSRRR
jgi:hypothetical protein